MSATYFRTPGAYTYLRRRACPRRYPLLVRQKVKKIICRRHKVCINTDTRRVVRLLRRLHRAPLLQRRIVSRRRSRCSRPRTRGCRRTLARRLRRHRKVLPVRVDDRLRERRKLGLERRRQSRLCDLEQHIHGGGARSAQTPFVLYTYTREDVSESMA